MTDFQDGMHFALVETDDFLKLINGLPSDMQLVMVRGYVANMLKKYEQPAEIEEAA
jgi:lipopolysaccharide/colanic/teichoic acid biosynthesis glycosyltransferase